MIESHRHWTRSITRNANKMKLCIDTTTANSAQISSKSCCFAIFSGLWNWMCFENDKRLLKIEMTQNLLKMKALLFRFFFLFLWILFFSSIEIINHSALSIQSVSQNEIIISMDRSLSYAYKLFIWRICSNECRPYELEWSGENVMQSGNWIFMIMVTI